MPEHVVAATPEYAKSRTRDAPPAPRRHQRRSNSRSACQQRKKIFSVARSRSLRTAPVQSPHSRSRRRPSSHLSPLAAPAQRRGGLLLFHPTLPTGGGRLGASHWLPFSPPTRRHDLRFLKDGGRNTAQAPSFGE
ncbi:hypothetical protein EJB05_35115, partial [Eragrostis curvula]